MTDRALARGDPADCSLRFLVSSLAWRILVGDLWVGICLRGRCENRADGQVVGVGFVASAIFQMWVEIPQPAIGPA